MYYRIPFNEIENKIKNNEYFYEDIYGFMTLVKCTSEVKSTITKLRDMPTKQLSWTGYIKDRGVIDYMITEGFTHYGPKLYERKEK